MRRTLAAGFIAFALSAGGAWGAARPATDHACAVPCVKQLHECSDAARTTLKTCLGPCQTLRDAAAAACGSTRGEAATPSATCAAALAALESCVRPCRDDARRAARACVLAGVQCLHTSCGHRAPPATPTQATPEGSN